MYENPEKFTEEVIEFINMEGYLEVVNKDDLPPATVFTLSNFLKLFYRLF